MVVPTGRRLLVWAVAFVAMLELFLNALDSFVATPAGHFALWLTGAAVVFFVAFAAERYKVFREP